MDAAELVRYQLADGVATITLDRPERKNAFTLEMLDACGALLRRAAGDDEARSIVITGSGDSFCAGVDLDVLAQLDNTPLARKLVLTERVHELARVLRAVDKPVIAAVNGVAVGAGLDIALMCDLRFAASSARMSEGYIRVGLVPGEGGCYLLPRLIGPARALELLMTGRFVDAAEALSIGMVNRVYDDAELAAQAHAFAAELASLSPIPMQIIKRSVYQAATSDFGSHLDAISSHMAVVQSTADYAEAQAAFRERRQPVFTGH
jgi:enoyl-CoA hydratase/carnithine racemase